MQFGQALCLAKDHALHYIFVPHTLLLLFDIHLEFVSPDFVLEEIYKYENYICVKSGLAKEEFELLLALVFERISIIPFSEYSACNDAAAAIMVNDPKDMPYVACFLALKCDGIWTNDPDYDGKEGVKVINTGDLLALL